jgi:tetratricopeptide (TPR) repeat protein
MEPMNPDDRMRLFESLLRQDLEIRCDFAAMEKALFERINAADRLGPLASLKAEHTAPPGFFDKVETDLFARIQNHREYEQPVNDIIAGPVKPSDMELRRIENRLDVRIDDAARLEPWEQYLKAEVPLPMGRWEAVEEKLFARVERHRKLEQVAPPSFWLGLGLYLRRPVTATATAMALMAAVAALIAGLRFAGPDSGAIETLVYQAQGAAMGGVDSAFAAGRPSVKTRADISSKDDGAMILVNRRGFVEMRNGSNLRIERAERGRLGYRVGFAGNGGADRGNVTFYVNKRKGREKYDVATADYRIEVVGTYFRVQPDPGGRVSTSVLEGKVKIHSEAYGEFEVGAGQTLIYDAALGRYRVQDGGASVRREDIDTVPGVDELGRYGVLTVAPASAGEAGAEVRIDGKYKGATPMVVLLPPGRHSIRLSLDGRAAADTSILVQDGGASRLSLALPLLHSVPVAVSKALPGAKPPARAAAKPDKAQKPEKAAAQPALSRAEEADLIYRKADEVQARDWQSAITLYHRVLDNPASKPLRREAALFSIARLRAEHEREKTRAKEDFLGYLAQYPDGAFSGESWLRLAELEVGRDQGKAIRYYLRAIEKLPRHPRLSELQHRVGLLYLQDKRYDEAVAMFRQSLGNVLYANEAEKRKIYQSLYRAFVAKGDRKNADLIDKAYRPSEEDSAFP